MATTPKDKTAITSKAVQDGTDEDCAMIKVARQAGPCQIISSKTKAKFVLPPCRVCGDQAAGFHYGANTCEACKGFFHRSLRRKGEYKCLGVGGGCDVKPGKQRSCPRCRYQRCLETGMSRAAIKTGRYTYVKRNQDALEVQRLEILARHAEHFGTQSHSTKSNIDNQFTIPPNGMPQSSAVTSQKNEILQGECKPDKNEHNVPVFLDPLTSLVIGERTMDAPKRSHDNSESYSNENNFASPMELSSPSSSTSSVSSTSSRSSVEMSGSERMPSSVETMEMLDFLDLNDNTISHVSTMSSRWETKEHASLKSQTPIPRSLEKRDSWTERDNFLCYPTCPSHSPQSLSQEYQCNTTIDTSMSPQTNTELSSNHITHTGNTNGMEHERRPLIKTEVNEEGNPNGNVCNDSNYAMQQTTDHNTDTAIVELDKHSNKTRHACKSTVTARVSQTFPNHEIYFENIYHDHEDILDNVCNRPAYETLVSPEVQWEEYWNNNILYPPNMCNRELERGSNLRSLSHNRQTVDGYSRTSLKRANMISENRRFEGRGDEYSSILQTDLCLDASYPCKQSQPVEDECQGISNSYWCRNQSEPGKFWFSSPTSTNPSPLPVPSDPRQLSAQVLASDASPRTSSWIWDPSMAVEMTVASRGSLRCPTLSIPFGMLEDLYHCKEAVIDNLVQSHNRHVIDLNTWFVENQKKKESSDVKIENANFDRSLQVISRWLDRSVRGLVQFARAIPGFSTLPMKDRMALIKEARLDFNALTLAQANIPWDSFLDYHLISNGATRELTARNLCRLRHRIQGMGLSMEEIVLTKALVVFASDRAILNETRSADEILYQLTICLLHVLEGNHSRPGQILGQVVSLLVEVQTMTKDFLQDLKNLGLKASGLHPPFLREMYTGLL